MSDYNINKQKFFDYFNNNKIVNYEFNEDEDTYKFSYYQDNNTRIFVEYHLGLGSIDISVSGCKIHEDCNFKQMEDCIKKYIPEPDIVVIEADNSGDEWDYDNDYHHRYREYYESDDGYHSSDEE